MNWNDLKDALLKGFEEIAKNPEIIIECAEDTIEDAEGLVDKARPVISALAVLFGQVGELKNGVASRDILQNAGTNEDVKRLSLLEE